MHKEISLFLVGFFFTSSVALADVAGDLEAGLGLDVVLGNAVAEGKTIDEAVKAAIQAQRDRASDIVAAAAALAPSLPPQACKLLPMKGTEYRIHEQDPKLKVGVVVDRYFRKGDIAMPDPDWAKGEYHLLASIDELEELMARSDVERELVETLKGPIQQAGTYIYDPFAARGEHFGRNVIYKDFPVISRTVARPVFISMYRRAERILLAEGNPPVDIAKRRGMKEFPVVFYFVDDTTGACQDLITTAAVEMDIDPSIVAAATAAGAADQEAPTGYVPVVLPTNGPGGIVEGLGVPTPS